MHFGGETPEIGGTDLVHSNNFLPSYGLLPMELLWVGNETSQTNKGISLVATIQSSNIFNLDDWRIDADLNRPCKPMT